MSAPVLATKLHIPPRRPNFVHRPRLIEQLNQGPHRKLTLVSAPAGFGKTTLVSEWLANCGKAAAWLSLDEGDSEPARFWSHVIAAIQTFAPHLGTGAMAALQSPQLPPPESLLTSLLNEIESIADAFVLVLDDFHLVDSKQVNSALAYLIERQPPNLHLVVSTREDPDLPLARLRARDQLTELRTRDLRFTASEAASFLNQAMGLSLSSEDVAALETRTEGWIAGLQLAALSMQGLQDTAGFIRSFTGSHRFVLDYLLEEVLRKQSDSIQTFLVRTSALERMCGPLCDVVLPSPSSTGQETLEQLERTNLFVVPLDNERRWYRYHHLFRDLLRQHLSNTASSEEIARVHIQASTWLEAHGDMAEAFQHALAAADVDRAARLAEAAWQAMEDSFQTRTWLGWVDRLPASVIRVRPVLCTQIGLAHMNAGNIDASEASLREAEQSLKLPSGKFVVVEEGQFAVLPARIAFVRAYNAQSQNRFADVVKYAEMALELIPNRDDFMYVQVSTVLSGTRWANGSLDDACKLVSDFVEASGRAGNIYFAIAGAFGKADIQNAQGRLRDVLQTYQQALELAAAHDAEQHTAHHHLGLGMLYHEMGDEERARRHLQKGFELGRHTTIVDWAYRESLAKAQLKESEGDFDSALDLLDEARRFHIRTPTPDLRPVDAIRARIYLRQGNLLRAQEWAQKSALSLHDAPDYLHEYERITIARVALAECQNDPNEQLWLDTFGLLERQLKLAENQDRLRGRIEVLIVQALALHSRREAAKAIKSLRQALTLAEPEGYLRIFAAEGQPMMDMLSDLNTGYLESYAARILAVFPQSHSRHPSSRTPHPLIEPLSERELEVLRLVAQGFSNQEISQKLYISLSTVKGHNLRIFGKLHAKSRTEAVARARELGLL